MVGSAVGTLRWIFFALDSVVYGLIGQIYKLFVMISEATFISQATIEDFASRIYVLISIIMAFRLAFSFINYIVKPDEITDKQKGGTKLITNIVLTVALLASVPTIFNELYYLQGVMVSNHVVERIVLGDSSTVLNTDSNVGEEMAARVFFSFFKPSVKVNGCSVFTSTECINNLNDSNKAKEAGTLFLKAYESKSLKNIWGSDISNIIVTSLSSEYVEDKAWGFEYTFGISTLGGIVICWILIGFCFDAAIRTVKLAVLQMIAPIPIIMNLAPDSKNKTVSNWFKEVGSTWISLFLRILIVSFSIYLINLVSKEGGVFSFVSGGGSSNILVSVFITFGILLFAKEFPKFLEDLLGIKGVGKMTFNAFKKLGSVPLVGGLATAGISYAGNFGKNVVAAGVNKIRGKDTNFKENMGFAGQEFKSRLQHSGIMGNDKAYSGDTQHKQVAKRNQEQRKKIIDAERGLESKDKLWRMGHKSAERQKLDENSTFDDYQRAGYKNKNFINAVMGIEQTKSALKDEQSKLRVSNEQVSALTNRLYNMDASDPEYSNVQVQLAQATHDRDGYQESVEKIEKSLKTRNDIFEQNIAPQSQKDYELYQARNVAKGERPTNYNTSASIPRFTDTHYHPEQNVIPQMTSQEQRLSEENRNNLASTTTSNNSQNNDDSSSGGGIISGIR